MEADGVMEKGNEVGSGPRPHVATQGGGVQRCKEGSGGPTVRQHPVLAEVGGVRRVAAVRHGTKTGARGPV
jgi:hypothetical protein